MRFKAVIILILTLFFWGKAFADTLVLKSGKEVQGEIIENSEDYIRINYQGAPIYYEKKIIQSIREEHKDNTGGAKVQNNNSPGGNDGAAAPFGAVVFMRHGLELASQGNFEEAGKVFRKGLEADSDDPNFKGALSILDDLSQKKISEEFALSLFKGSYFLERQNYGQAAASLEEALKLKPGDPDISYNLAIAYQNINKEDDAIKCLNTVLEVNPQDAQAYSLMGTIYYSKGEYDRAKEYFTLAMGVYKKNGLEDKAEEISGILKEF
jgi:tetratricopeptide (TPR) repeat protein